MYWAEPGDVLVRLSGGGSGVGDPHERDPALVQEDVRNGLISAEVAREVYRLPRQP
jgi:N-methylhydantoinase B